MAFRIISPKNRLNAIIKSCYLNQNKFYKTFARNICTSAPRWKRVAFNLSDIGEGIREVVVKEWFIKEGDIVQQFDNLCEVQSDKASVTITSRFDGKILKIYHNVDETALVGKPLIEFDVTDSDEGSSDSDITESVSSSSQSSTSDDRNVDVQKTLETNKKDDDITSSTASTKSGKILTTPAVRRIAHENKVNLSDVRASGPNGRILKSDVLEYLNIIPATNDSNRSRPLVERTQTTTATAAAATVAAAASESSSSNIDRVEKLKDIRKVMFKSMTAALKIPHFTYSDEVNVTELVKLRDTLKCDATAQYGIKLTFMPFFIKAASLALTKYPILNSQLDEPNESIVYQKSHNISIAMATQNGLIVPNVKNCEQKTILQIARDLNDLLERGRSGKMTPADYQNGTFSLSNIGVIGGTYTKPVIAPPQVAIGAIGTTSVVPRFVDETSDRIQRVHLIHVSWSADHRVIDGVTMASFSNEWKRFIENPQRFVLQ